MSNRRECMALQCPKECDFVIGVCGHDFEMIESGLEAYDECPNCSADLEEAHITEDIGRVIIYE